jgi:hypothetical protein
MKINRPVLLTEVPSPLTLEGATEALYSDSLPSFLLSHYSDSQIDIPASDCKTQKSTLSAWYASGKNRPYLKDWHVNKDLRLFSAPSLFRDDWFNGSYEFLYWGSAGSRTERHSDVMHSFSWSVSLLGIKKWTFFFGDEHVSLTQTAMSAVFVPSGVEHEVENLTECISVNCNWFNRYNVEKVYFCLKAERAALIKELQGFGVKVEIGNNTDTIEAMMPAACGMKISGFWKIVKQHGSDTHEGRRVIHEIERDFTHLV